MRGENDGMRLWTAQRVRQELAKLPAWQKVRILLGRKYYLYHEQRKNWTGQLPIYLFRCGNCGEYTLDYPQGPIDRRYLFCYHCKTQTDFVPWWVPWARLWKVLRLAWRYRLKPAG